MNDIKNLVIYLGITLGMIIGLNYLYDNDVVSGSVVGAIAIVGVIILPVIIAIRLSSKERERQQ